LAATSAVPNGSTLTLNLAVNFKPAFVGAKNVYMFGSSFGGPASGWQTRGAWTATAGTVTVGVTADSVAPASGTGGSQTFALQYSDAAGATDLATAWVWFNATFASSSANSCLAYYSRPTNVVSLLNDAGTGYLTGTPGTSATLQNAQCAIALSGTSVALSGTTATLNLAVSFKSPFVGAKNVYMYVASIGGSASGWQTRGTWTATAGAVTASVTADSVSPASGSGASQTFALRYSDTAGAPDLATAWVWFNATFASSSANSCLAYYNRATNVVNLLNDAGTGYLTGTPGTTATLQNSQCSIALGGTTVAISGTTLTLNLAVTFKSAFAGAKNAYIYGASLGGLSSGWQTRGVWTVP
jgi:hypothetical protein